MKTLLPLLVVALLIGCSEPKVDAEKLNKANEMVMAGDFEGGITILNELGTNSPSDVSLRHSRVQAHLRYAAFLMYNDTIPQNVKYRLALKQFNHVLKLDPEQKDAREQKDLIEGIYKQMGREIPSDES